MRKLTLVLLLFLITFSCFISCDLNSSDVVEKDETKWNVLIYLCGSTLEEAGGYGSYNLNEIANTKPNENVDVYIMTGGVRSVVDGNTAGWMNRSTDSFGNHVFCDAVYDMDLSGSVDGNYQYWKYVADSRYNGYGSFQEITVPSRGMDDGETLQNFIEIFTNIDGKKRKNALVLWDHGGGLLGGLLSDYSDDTPDKNVMSLNELGNAIEESGVEFDAVITDLCVMQSLETALTLCDNASYLIGSQSEIYASGLAYSKWIQYAYDNPKCSGLELGKAICDSHAQKYALADPNYTSSVVDLSQVKSLATSFDSIYRKAYSLIDEPSEIQKFVSVILNSQDFENRMYDIEDATDLLRKNGLIEASQYLEIKEKLEKTVVYNRVGQYRTKASGLSFMFFLGNGLKTDSDVFKYIENYAMETMPSFFTLMNTRYAEKNKDAYSLQLSVKDGKLQIPYSQRDLVATVGVQHILKSKNSNNPDAYYSYYLLDENNYTTDKVNIEYSSLKNGQGVIGMKGRTITGIDANGQPIYEDYAVPIPMYEIMARIDSDGLYTRMKIPFFYNIMGSGYLAVIYDHESKEYTPYYIAEAYSSDNSRKSCLTDISVLTGCKLELCSATVNSLLNTINSKYLYLDANNTLTFEQMTLDKDAICGTDYELGYRYVVYDTFGVANVSEIVMVD